MLRGSYGRSSLGPWCIDRSQPWTFRLGLLPSRLNVHVHVIELLHQLHHHLLLLHHIFLHLFLPFLPRGLSLGEVSSQYLGSLFRRRESSYHILTDGHQPPTCYERPDITIKLFQIVAIYKERPPLATSERVTKASSSELMRRTS